MRAGRNWIFWLLQLDPPHDLTRDQIQLRYLRRIPQTAPCASSVSGGNHCVWKRRWNEIVRAQIKTVNHFAACHIQQQNVVRKVVRHQEPIVPSVGNQRQPRGIRDRGSRRRLLQTDRNSLSGRKSLRLDSDEPLRPNFTVDEAVDRNSIAGVSRLLSRRICNRTHRGVEMLPVRAEYQAEEIALVYLFAKALIGIVGDLIRLQIEDGN